MKYTFYVLFKASLFTICNSAHKSILFLPHSVPVNTKTRYRHSPFMVIALAKSSYESCSSRSMETVTGLRHSLLPLHLQNTVHVVTSRFAFSQFAFLTIPSCQGFRFVFSMSSSNAHTIHKHRESCLRTLCLRQLI